LQIYDYSAKVLQGEKFLCISFLTKE